MLKTIHVEIDPSGHIHSLEPIPFKLEGKALLTLLETDTNDSEAASAEIKGNAARALRLLASPRFQHRPIANTEEMQRHITAIRDEWNND